VETRQKGKGKENTAVQLYKLGQGDRPSQPNQPALPSMAELMEAPPQPISREFIPWQGVATPSLYPRVDPSNLVRRQGGTSSAIYSPTPPSPSISVYHLGQLSPAPRDHGLIPWSPGSHQLTPEDGFGSEDGPNERDDSDEADSPFGAKRSWELSQFPSWTDEPAEVNLRSPIPNQKSGERQLLLGEQLACSIESGFKNVTQDIQTGFDRLASMLVIRNTPSQVPQARHQPTWTPKTTTNPSRRSFSQKKKAVRKNRSMITTRTEHNAECRPRASDQAGRERQTSHSISNKGSGNCVCCCLEH